MGGWTRARIYALQINQQHANSFDPTDATTYYMGVVYRVPDTTESFAAPIFIRRAGTIVAASVTIVRYGTAPTSETLAVRVRLNEATDVAIETKALTAGAGPITDEFLNSGLSQAVAVGDRLRFSMLTPTWATNPTDLRIQGYVIIEDG